MRFMPGRGVGHEGDLVGLGADEARDRDANRLAALHPGVPGPIALLFELPVEAVDRRADRARRGTVAAAFRYDLRSRGRGNPGGSRPRAAAWGGRILERRGSVP